MPPAQQAPMVPAVPDIYAPWRMHAPTAFVMGLQKSGTTLVGATLAAAMGTPYEPEAVGNCCKALDMEGCARKAEEYEQTYNFLPHGKSCQAAFWAPDGSDRLLTTSWDCALRVWDGVGAASGKMLSHPSFRLEGEPGSSEALAAKDASRSDRGHARKTGRFSAEAIRAARAGADADEVAIAVDGCWECVNRETCEPSQN